MKAYKLKRHAGADFDYLYVDEKDRVIVVDYKGNKTIAPSLTSEELPGIVARGTYVEVELPDRGSAENSDLA